MIIASARYRGGRRVDTDLGFDDLRTFVRSAIPSAPTPTGASAGEDTVGSGLATRPGEDESGGDGGGGGGDHGGVDEFVWVGLHEPTRDDIAEIAEIFGLPELAVEDAVQAHQRSKVERYGDILFTVVKPAEFTDGELRVSELAVFIGDRFVIGVRHGPSGVVQRVRREIDSGDAPVEHGPLSVLYRLMDRVVDDYEVAIEQIEVDIDDLEALVFGPSGESHAEPTYQMKRTVATLRRLLLPLAISLQRVVAGGIIDLPGGMGHYFRDLHDHLQRATDELETQDRLLSDVLQADLAKVGVHQAEISLRQNEDQRKMSAWAAIGLLPTAVGGVYGMNFRHMPELDWRYSYPTVLLLIALGCFLLYRNFRHRGWL